MGISDIDPKGQWVFGPKNYEKIWKKNYLQKRKFENNVKKGHG